MRRPALLAHACLALVLSLPLLPGTAQAARAPELTQRLPASPSERLQQLADAYFEAGLELDPMGGSAMLGEARFEGRLEILIAPAHQARARQVHERLLSALDRIEPATLSEEDQTTLTLLRQRARHELSALKRPGALMPINQYGGLPVNLAEQSGGQGLQQFDTERQLRGYLKRLQRLPDWNAQAIANMREGLRQGISVPQPLIERALQSLESLANAPAATHPYLRPVRGTVAKSSASPAAATVPAFPAFAALKPAAQAQLRAEYRRTLETRLRPSLRELVRFLRQDYLPQARRTAGLGALPDGAAWYAEQVALHTTTALTPAQIHEIGLREVARLHGEIARLQARLGDSGPLSEFLRGFDDRPGMKPYASEAEILASYEAINARVKTQLPALFKRSPRAALAIRPEPEISRATASDHYEGPSLDGSRPGVFYAVITDPRQYALSWMSSLFLHEGQPGHHFQVARQQELQLPRFRQYDWVTAYGEGWALYAETLGHEMGLYANDDVAYMGHLRMALLRAVRLVTDTGLHAMGWSREQTMAYMQATEGADEDAARRATERYMADPGQALGYMIGALKIRELRDRAQARLGERFSYAEFHEQVLSGGCLPLDLLEARIERWLAAASS